MIQEAINALLELLEKYPQICGIEIVDRNDIRLKYTIQDESFTKVFEDAIELLEWCEIEFKSEIIKIELKEWQVKNLRSYFGENDKTQTSHWAYSIFNKALKK